MLFRHGEKLYGFRGLRAYKEKFQPLWAPRYIAGPGGLSLLRALRDLNLMIGRPRLMPDRGDVPVQGEEVSHEPA